MLMIWLSYKLGYFASQCYSGQKKTESSEGAYVQSFHHQLNTITNASVPKVVFGKRKGLH